MNFDQWLKFGIEQGWISPSICYTHDGVPTTKFEDENWEELDPCVHILRLYESAEVKAEVEENFSPAVWRK